MSKSKKSAKKPAAAATPTAKPKIVPEATGLVSTMMVRAIRVTAEVLAAAKTYKKEKGVSFYRLGLEAISDRLKREGYLKAAETGTGA